MPTMTRAHYNLIADATAQIIAEAGRHISGEAFAMFRMNAAKAMTNSLAGTNSQFKRDRFYDRCCGIRSGR